MKKLLSKPDIAEILGISETSIDDQRKRQQFPAPLVCKKWSQGQLDDYVSQLEAYGGWSETRYIEAMEARRATLAG